MVLAPHVADRHVPQHGPSTNHVDPHRVRPLLQQPQLEFAHRALEPEQQAVVQLTRIVDAVVIDQQRVGQSAEVDEMVPVAVVPRQPRGFEREHRPGGPIADGGQEPREARALLVATPRPAEVVVDDVRPTEAETLGMFREGILPLLSFLVMADLVPSRLPDVHVGGPFTMRRPDLLSHRPSAVIAPPEERSAAIGPTGVGSGDAPPRIAVPPGLRSERAGAVAGLGSVSPCASRPPRHRVAQASSSDLGPDNDWPSTRTRRLRRAARPIRGRSSARNWSQVTGSNIHRGTAICASSGRRITTMSA